MSDEPTATDGPRTRSRAWRWALVVPVVLGLAYLVLSFVPIYHVEHERDPTQGVADFLRKLQSFQAEHLQRHGRYLGDEAWAEWPPGPFPSSDGASWGTPTGGPWAALPLRPQQPVLFKLRLRASDDPGRAPEGLLPAAPTGPWYVVQARADLDGDGVIWLIEISSAVGVFYIENSGD